MALAKPLTAQVSLSLLVAMMTVVGARHVSKRHVGIGVRRPHVGPFTPGVPARLVCTEVPAMLRKCSLTQTKAVNPEEEHDLPLMQAALMIFVAMYWQRC